MDWLSYPLPAAGGGLAFTGPDPRPHQPAAPATRTSGRACRPARRHRLAAPAARHCRLRSPGFEPEAARCASRSPASSASSAPSTPANTPPAHDDSHPPHSRRGHMSTPQKCPLTRHDSRTASDNRRSGRRPAHQRSPHRCADQVTLIRRGRPMRGSRHGSAVTPTGLRSACLVTWWRGVLAELHRPRLELGAQESAHEPGGSADAAPVVVPQRRDQPRAIDGKPKVGQDAVPERPRVVPPPGGGLIRPRLYQHVIPSRTLGHCRHRGRQCHLRRCRDTQATTVGLPSDRSAAPPRPRRACRVLHRCPARRR
jgi:hypothetical protein